MNCPPTQSVSSVSRTLQPAWSAARAAAVPLCWLNKAEAFAPAHLDKELYINGFSVGYSTPLGWL